MALRVLTVLAGASVGGAETFFVTLTSALARAGLSLHSVLKPNALREEALRHAGIPYANAAFASPADFSTRAVLRRTAAAFRPDIVLAFAGRAASFVPKGDYAVIGRLGGYYTLRNFRNCDVLVCNAPGVMRHVIEGGWPQDKAVLIPNFPFVPDAPALSRAVFGTPEDAPLAVALGRLHKNKGLDLLIRAAAAIPQLFVWIAGEGPEHANLARLAQAVGVSDRVRFLGWRSDRAALYKAADVCVYPSREEPFGNVVVEAWACGTPIVTTASEGPGWLVRDRQDGLLTPADDAGALAGAIRTMLASNDLRARLAAGGRRRIAEEFSEEAIVRRYIALFEEVRR